MRDRLDGADRLLAVAGRPVSHFLPNIERKVGTPVILRPSPFKFETIQHVAVPGQTLEQILRAIPELPPEIWTHGVIKIGEWEIPRENWARVRPREGSRHLIKIGVRMGGGGKGGGGKNVFAMIAAIALLVVTTAITGGAAAGLFGTTLFAAGSTSAALLAGGVAVVGALAINALAPSPAKARKSDQDRGDTGAGSASFGGNTLEPFAPIPFVAGTHRIQPPHLIAPWTESTNDDQYVYAIVGCNGAHQFSDIRLNGAPIEEFQDVEYEIRDVVNDDSDITLIDSQVFELQLGVELPSHKLKDNATDQIQDVDTPPNSYPRWQTMRARSKPDEIWLTFAFPGLIFQKDDGTGTAAAGLGIRIQIRRQGDTAWINLPEFHAQRERLEQFRGTIKLLFQAAPTTITRPDQLTSFPPWKAALYVTNADNAEGFDVNSYFTATSAKYANKVGSEDGAVLVYLDPATFPKGIYDIQVKRSYGYKANDLSLTAYTLGGNVPYFFSHTASSSPPSIRQQQSKVPSKVGVQSISSVWNEYPLGEKGISLIAIKAKNVAISQLSVLARGYANTWDGTDWTTFEPTNNPAAWWRYLALGGQSIRAPFIAAQLDDDSLTDWYDFCGKRTDAADFDGTTTYLTRDGGLTGAADGKVLTGSFWVRSDNFGGFSRVFSTATTLAGATFGSRVEIDATSGVSIFMRNAAGTGITDLRTGTLPIDTWLHVLFSIDLSSTSKRWLYINDISSLNIINTYTNDTIDFTMADWAIGAGCDGTQKFPGSIAELWLAPGVYLDLSVEANRRKFIDSRGRPAALGTTGNLPTGSAPLVYLSGAVPGWATNKGTGGGFTTHGDLTGGPAKISADQAIYECNAYFSNNQNIGDVLSIVGGCGRAAYRRSDKAGVIIERDRTAELPIELFSQRNSRGLAIKRAFPRLPDGFRVKFNDESNDYLPTEIFVYRNLDQIDHVEAIDYVGITDQALAMDRANLDLSQLLRRASLYSLETDIQNLYCTKGSLVVLAHDTVRRHYDSARVDTATVSSGNLTGMSLDSTLRLDLVAQSDDFSADAVSSPPAHWTKRWDLNTTANVASVAQLPSGQGPLFVKTTGTGDAFWSFDTFEPVADCEILTLIRPHADPGTTTNAIGVVLRGSGASGTQTGYRAVLNSNSGGAKDKIEISKWVNGTFTFLANATFNWLLDTNYWIRFRAVGTSLKVKVWLEGTTEPGSWTVSTTDSAIAAAGWAGAYIFNPSSSFYLGSFRAGPMCGTVIQLKDGTTITLELNETDEDQTVTFMTPPPLPSYLTDRGVWATSTSYAIDDVVVDSGIAYSCIQAHTSGTTTRPASGVDWVSYWEALLRDCLAVSGPFSSVEKRMIVLGVTPQSEMTAALTLVDEAPPVRILAPDGVFALDNRSQNVLAAF